MANEGQDSSKIESKFKLSLLQVEKRFVDLETTISEVIEKVKDVDLAPIPELKERVDDIEDLIMVEQAGILELKKMLEEMQGKTGAPAVDLSGFENKIAELEKKLSIPVTGVDLQPVFEQVNALKLQIEEKMKGLESIRTELKPAMDVEFVSSKYETVQKGLNDLLNKKIEMDLKVEGLKKNIEMVEHKIGEMASEKIAEEIENNKRDVILVNAKIDTIEKIVRVMTSDLQQIQLSMGKFESFDKLTFLGKEIESKIERFKLIEDELRRLSSRMEMMYTNMDKRLDAATQAEKKLPEIFDSINNIKKELDKNKIEILDRVSKEDFNRQLKEVMQSTNLKDVAKKSDLQVVYKMKSDLDNKINDINRKMGQVKVDEILKLLQIVKEDVDTKIKSLEQGEGSVLNETIKKVEWGIDEMDYRFQDLLDKFTYLETRMSALEKMIMNVRMQPIILE